MSHWPIVALKDVVKLDLQKVDVDSVTEYPMVGVLSFGRGLFDKEPITNGKTSYRVFYQLKPQHIVLSQLFGWEGALALSSEQFAGKYLSPQFPTFLTDESRLDRHYLGWLMKRPHFWDELGSRASGMGDRRRTLNPEALFTCQLPLPPLTVQRRLVEQLDALASKIEEAKTLRREANVAQATLICSVHHHLAAGRVLQMADILVLDEDRTKIDHGMEYPQVGVKGFGGGLFPREAVSSTQTTYKYFNRLYPGAVVLSQVKGWEGAIAVCPDELSDRFASPEYRTFRCKTGVTSPTYLSALIPTPWFWQQLAGLSRGVGGRRERIRPELFAELKLTMPTLQDQQRAIQIFERVKQVQNEHATVLAELEAMLPAILDRAFRGEL